MSALVLGATGFVGRTLCAELCAAGERGRGASRKGTPEGHSGGLDIEWVRCDLREPETLGPALEGVDCVYYLVHSMGKGSGNFRDTERRCANDLARAAAVSGCSRIVYLGGVAPNGPPSEHLASRLEVGDILRAGSVTTIELRAAMIVGEGGASWRIVRDLSMRLPLMILPRWLESRSCPIALDDVITALVDARRLPLSASAWFDIPGPDVMSAREMLQVVAGLCGRRVPMLRVPILSPRLSALWLRFVTDADRELARELVLGLAHDLLPRDASYWQLSGHPPRWSFEAAARHALAAERGKASDPRRLAHWEERVVERLGKAALPAAPAPKNRQDR